MTMQVFLGVRVHNRKQSYSEVFLSPTSIHVALECHLEHQGHVNSGFPLTTGLRLELPNCTLMYTPLKLSEVYFRGISCLGGSVFSLHVGD